MVGAELKVGLNVEFSAGEKANGLVFMVMLLCWVRLLGAGETGVNGVLEACIGTNALNSAFIENGAGLACCCGIVGTNGFPVALLWKPFWAAEGLNVGAKTLVESFEV